MDKYANASVSAHLRIQSTYVKVIDFRLVDAMNIDEKNLTIENTAGRFKTIIDGYDYADIEDEFDVYVGHNYIEPFYDSVKVRSEAVVGMRLSVFFDDVEIVQCEYEDVDTPYERLADMDVDEDGYTYGMAVDEDTFAEMVYDKIDIDEDLALCAYEYSGNIKNVVEAAGIEEPFSLRDVISKCVSPDWTVATIFA